MPKFAVLLCRFVKHVLLHRRQNTEVPLQALVVVVNDVVFNHSDQALPVGKPPAVVPLPLEDSPEALHWTVINKARLNLWLYCDTISITKR